VDPGVSHDRIEEGKRDVEIVPEIRARKELILQSEVSAVRAVRLQGMMRDGHHVPPITGLVSAQYSAQ
jgi:hypothetical protein